MVDTGGSPFPARPRCPSFRQRLRRKRHDRRSRWRALTVKITYKGDYVEGRQLGRRRCPSWRPTSTSPSTRWITNAVSPVGSRAKFGIFKGFSASGRVRVLVDRRNEDGPW